MRFRPLMLPLGALALLVMASASPAGASGQNRQAALRISLTVVDSCDIALPATPPAGQPEAAEVECSAFMPHALAVTPWAPAPGRAMDALSDTAPPAFPHESEARAFPVGPALRPAEPQVDQIRIATITF